MHINTYYVNKEEQSRIVFILEYIIKRKFHTNVAARAELHSPDIIKPGNSFCLLTIGQHTWPVDAGISFSDACIKPSSSQVHKADKKNRVNIVIPAKAGTQKIIICVNLCKSVSKNNQYYKQQCGSVSKNSAFFAYSAVKYYPCQSAYIDYNWAQRGFVKNDKFS